MFSFGLRVPEAETEAVDEHFANFEAWARPTHAGPAEPYPIDYHITKTPESQDPMDPSKGTTGHVLYNISLCMSGAEACKQHVELLVASGPVARHLGIITKYKVALSSVAPVVQSMPALAETRGNVKKGFLTFTLFLVVPPEEEARVDKFFADHKDYMEKTHSWTVGPEPCALFYAVTKQPELLEPLDLGATGTTGNLLYVLTEVYSGEEGCKKHFETAAAEGPMAEFQALVGAYSKLFISFAPVAFTV